MRAGLFQYKIKWEDKKHNRAKILKLIESSDIRGVDWIIFPEMSLSGFTNNIKYSTLNEDDLNFFSLIAKRYNVNISFGGVEERQNKIITLNRNGERISEYSKINLFVSAKEDKFYKKGKKTITFDLEGFKVTPFICFDIRFPVLFWKTSANTSLYVVIAAWPYKRINHWTSLLQARAIENQAYVIGVNSIGEDEDGNEYKGYSLCYSPSGDLLLDCQSREGMGAVDIVSDVVADLRTRFKIPR